MFPNFDPSKMDPKVMMELSQLIQQLPSDQLSRMQTLMHNAMAGFDVRRDMEEFERNLPPGFREKLMTLMSGQMDAFTPPPPTPAREKPATVQATPETATIPEMDLHEARITILRAVADQRMSPEEAERLLFK